MRDGYGVCPLCNGTCYVNLTEQEKTYSWNTNDGRCLTGYTCKHCGDRYQIDSGD